MPAKPSIRPRRSTSLSTGMVLVLIGLGTFTLSSTQDGFVKGLFQGATVALMVIAAYLLGSATFRKGTEEDLGDDAWLPSRDEH